MVARPLFVAPALGGEFDASLLANYFEDLPICLLPYECSEDAGRTLEGMATKIVRRLRAVQPFGPYHIAGYASGGVLAYEIATQLIGADQSVTFVGLLESEYYSDYYYAQPIPIPIHIFVAAGDQQTEERDDEGRIVRDGEGRGKFLGWDSVLSERQIRLICVPGTHKTMMRGPNIQILGNMLVRAIRSAEENPSESLERNYSPNYILQTGRRGTTPLFCIPGAGASVVSFIELIGELDSLRPILGFEPRGMDGLLVPHSTVEAAADLYLATTKETTEVGAVHLLGHSFGGWVAFDMALKLIKSQRKVASLTILDSEAPDERGAELRQYTANEVLRKWIDMLELVLGRPIETLPVDLDSINRAGHGQLLHEIMVRERLLPKGATPDVLRGPLRSFAQSLRTPYTPDAVYSGPVQLVVADDPRLDMESNRMQQRDVADKWSKWAPHLTCAYVAGNHMTLLKPPYVHTIARILKPQMDRANG